VRSRQGILTDLEDRILVGSLVVVLIWSVVAAVINVPPAWQIPPVFIALLAIVRMVAPMDHIEEVVQSIRTSVTVSVTRNDSAEDFYQDLTHAVRKATSHIDLTHMRDTPPEDFKGLAPTEYFSHLLDWLAVSDSRTIRRVICVRNAKMRVWAERLHEVSRTTPGFHVRVVDCGAAMPIINMAILDSREVYITFTGDIPERTPGVSMIDPVIGGYFSEYYTALWRAAVPLDDFLQKH